MKKKRSLKFIFAVFFGAMIGITTSAIIVLTDARTACCPVASEVLAYWQGY